MGGPGYKAIRILVLLYVLIMLDFSSRVVKQASAWIFFCQDCATIVDAFRHSHVLQLCSYAHVH